MTHICFRLSRLPLPAAVMALALSVAAPAGAQMFQDPALQALLQQGRPAELQRVARERLASRPDDDQAGLALGLAALETNDAAARRAAIERAQACTQARPEAATCHYALGVVLGVQAMSEGMLKAARSAGTVKAALTQAQVLAPGWYPARSALVEFHLLAPALMGGSTARAQELARAAPEPAQARVLQARVELQAGGDESVLAAVSGLLTHADAAVAEDAAQWGFAAASRLLNDGKPALAQPFLERLAREHPASASGPYGLARVRASAGEHAEALALYERAARGKGAANLPLDYRRGLALQSLGRKSEAREAYRRFVAAGKGYRPSLDDARKRLQELDG